MERKSLESPTIDPVVAVHTMGKVGSTSIARALRRAGFHALHTHHLNLAQLQEHAVRGNSAPHVSDSRLLIQGILEGRKIRLITLVRDPMSRNVATYLGYVRNKLRKDPVLAQSIAPETVAREFGDFHQLMEPITWWHEHLSEPLRADCLASEFDKELGWKMLEYPNIDLLIMRSDLDDRDKSHLLDSFLGVAGISVGRLNSTKEGEHAEFLASVRDLISPDPQLVETLLSAPEVTHWFNSRDLSR